MLRKNLKIFGSVSMLALISACSQAPAQIVMKGQHNYATPGSYQTQMVAAAPTPKPEVGVSQIASAETYTRQPSYGFQPSPSTVALRESAPMPEIAIKELEPITAVNSQPIETAKAQPVKPQLLPEPQARVVAESSVLPTKPAPVVASQPVRAPSEGYIWPVKGKVLSAFGPKSGGEYNDGINIAAREGDPIVAAADGVVVYSGNELRDYGNMVIIRHEDGIMSAYAHASRVLVSKGERVNQGSAIALVGKTGAVEQAQVHFGIRKNKEPVNPMDYLSGNAVASR